MAGQLLLVNPRKRRAPKRNPLTAKQKAQRDRSRAYSKKRRAAAGKRRKKAVAKAFRGFTKSVSKRTRSARKGFAKFAKGARRTKRRKPQSIKSMLTNPGGFARNTVLPAAVGAVGALALDAAYAYLPIPANFKNGALAPVVKIGAVGLLGAAVSHFAPQKQLGFVKTAVAASITVIAYGWLKGRMQAMLPGVRLGEFVEDDTGCPIPGVTPLAYWQAGVFEPDIGEYVSGDDGMSEYISGQIGYAESDSYSDMIS